MLSYLTSELSFVRAFGNRCLLLIFLCILTRSGDHFGKFAALGVSIDLNPGLVTIFGPPLALVIQSSLAVEANTLQLARLSVLDEATALPRFKSKMILWHYGLFATPSLCSAFLTLQYILNVALKDQGCSGRDWTRHFFNLNQMAGASVYCIRDVTDGMPWIYPPFQTYFYLGCVVACIGLTYGIAKGWLRFRGKAD